MRVVLSEIGGSPQPTSLVRSPDRLCVPYGHGEIEFMVQPHLDVDVVESASVPPLADLGLAVGEALRSLPLLNLAAGTVRACGPWRPRAVIAVTDLTRACPTPRSSRPCSGS